jgi:hypothetical protein
MKNEHRFSTAKRPGCQCIELGRAALAQKNIRVLCSIPWLASAPARVLLQTEKIDKRQRGPSVALTATFCPFCGRKYDGDGKGITQTRPSHLGATRPNRSTNSKHGVEKRNGKGNSNDNRRKSTGETFDDGRSRLGQQLRGSCRVAAIRGGSARGEWSQSQTHSVTSKSALTL